MTDLKKEFVVGALSMFGESPLLRPPEGCPRHATYHHRETRGDRQRAFECPAAGGQRCSFLFTDIKYIFLLRDIDKYILESLISAF